MTRGYQIRPRPHNPEREWEYTDTRTYLPATTPDDACPYRRDFWAGEIRRVSCVSLGRRLEQCQRCGRG